MLKIHFGIIIKKIFIKQLNNKQFKFLKMKIKMEIILKLVIKFN